MPKLNKFKELKREYSQLPEQIKFDCGCVAVKGATNYLICHFCDKHNPFKPKEEQTMKEKPRLMLTTYRNEKGKIIDYGISISKPKKRRDRHERKIQQNHKP